MSNYLKYVYFKVEQNDLKWEAIFSAILLVEKVFYENKFMLINFRTNIIH